MIVLIGVIGVIAGIGVGIFATIVSIADAMGDDEED